MRIKLTHVGTGIVLLVSQGLQIVVPEDHECLPIEVANTIVSCCPNAQLVHDFIAVPLSLRSKGKPHRAIIDASFR